MKGTFIIELRKDLEFIRKKCKCRKEIKENLNVQCRIASLTGPIKRGRICLPQDERKAGRSMDFNTYSSHKNKLGDEV